MIALDYGILYMISAAVNTLPETTDKFRIDPSVDTLRSLNRFQSAYKFLDSKGHLFASDVIARFSDTGNQYVLNNLNTTLFTEFEIRFRDKAVLELMKLKEADSVAVNGLPSALKPVYLIQLDNNSPEEKIIDNTQNSTDIIGLSPSFLRLKKNLVSSLKSLRTGNTFLPKREDDLWLYYDFTTAAKGVYEVNILQPNPIVKRVYVNPQLYDRPPYAIVEVTTTLIPETQGNSISVKDYKIKFSKK